ncbi:MAG: TetR/AcrR family transcriptional regulator [Promethearchaeota archaeon]|jgi:AcrR family transcriptional regulator
MSPKYKQTRARSEDKKADQFEKILEAGKELFLEKGSEGFSMRNLAEKLDMTKNNMYNYVESKRELWIAIRDKFYTQFKEENIEIIRNCEDSYINLLMELFEHFVEFAKRDFGVFTMMHTPTSAPPSSKVGPIEEKYRQFRLLDGNTKLLREAMDRGEIRIHNPALVSLFLYSLIFGATYIDMNRRNENPLLENIQLSIRDISSEDFQEYVLSIIEKLFKENML